MAMSDAYLLALKKSAADLQALRNMQDTFAFDEAVFGFHAQQACEKALKAWLLLLGIVPPFVHDLRRLIALLAQHGAVVAEADAIAELTDYAVEWRYDEMPGDELIDRPGIVALCERLFATVVAVKTTHAE